MWKTYQLDVLELAVYSDVIVAKTQEHRIRQQRFLLVFERSPFRISAGIPAGM